MAALKAGDVVVADFPGITGVKRRPAVVVSTDTYHSHRPDVLLGAITTNLVAAATPMDFALNDWAAAGLHRPSAFRTFLSGGNCYLLFAFDETCQNLHRK